MSKIENHEMVFFLSDSRDPRLRGIILILVFTRASHFLKIKNKKIVSDINIKKFKLYLNIFIIITANIFGDRVNVLIATSI